MAKDKDVLRTNDIVAVPEELVPLTPVGRMVLNRNPDNFFAETEQAVHRGRVAYEPNSLAGGCPFQGGTAGFVSFPDAMPKAMANPQSPEVTESPALSLMALPGECGVSTRQIAVLIDEIEADKSFENAPGFLFDALAIPDGSAAVQALLDNPDTMEFVKDQDKHGKTILAFGAGRKLLEKAGIEAAAEQDPGIILATSADAADIASTFMNAVAGHRHSSREMN